MASITTNPATPFGEIAMAARTWSGPEWLTAARRDAAARYEVAGLPTTALEAWRSSPLPALPKRPLSAGFASTANRAASLIATMVGDGAPTIVFVDGLHSVTLSSADHAWPQGVRVSPVSRVLAMKPDTLRPWLEAHDVSAGAFHDLNLAAFRDGAFVTVDDGVQPTGEVRVVLAATSVDEPTAQHVRNFVHVGRNARLRLTIVTCGLSEARGFLNAHLSVSLAEGARLDLARVHEAPGSLPQFDALRATIGPRAAINDTLLQTGSAWTRTEIDIALAGERATADLGGVFVARGTQTSDIHTILSHDAPGVASRQEFRGLAADEARGVFHGQIRVDPEARGADAVQHNKNLLLSRKAHVHSTPALEILTDDVKCKHGSATGQIDPVQLFYLRSRGIGLADATRILTRAFVGEILSRVTPKATRDLVERAIGPSLERLEVAA